MNFSFRKLEHRAHSLEDSGRFDPLSHPPTLSPFLSAKRVDGPNDEIQLYTHLTNGTKLQKTTLFRKNSKNVEF